VKIQEIKMKKIKNCFLALAIMPVFSYAGDAPFSPTGKFMSGDWGGVRDDLNKHGYDFTLDYGSMTTSNIAGGYNRSRTVRYSDQYVIGATLDLEKIAGIKGGKFRASVVDRNGRDLTVDRLQDPRAPVIGSGVQSNYGRWQTWHAAQFWYQQNWSADRFSLKTGLMPPGEDFDSDGCLFQNLSLCGSLAGHGSGVWYNTPVGQWGTRLRYNIEPRLYLQAGAFLYNPSYATRHGSFRLDDTGRRGAMYLAELGYFPHIGKQKLPGTLKIGAWVNTATASDVLSDDDGHPYVLSRRPPRQHEQRYGGWIYYRQQITAINGAPERGLSLFWHLALNDQSTALMDYQVQAGAIYQGLFSSRPEDSVALGFSKMHINSQITERARLLNDIRDAEDENNPRWTPVRHAEYAAELNYNAVITPWLVLRPNIQLLIHPGGVSEIKNAWVAGIQVSARL